MKIKPSGLWHCILRPAPLRVQSPPGLAETESQSKCLVRLTASVVSADCKLFQGRTKPGDSRHVISDERLMITSTQPQLEKQVVALVGRQRGQTKRMDGQPREADSGQGTGRQGRQHLEGLAGGQI